MKCYRKSKIFGNLEIRIGTVIHNYIFNKLKNADFEIVGLQLFKKFKFRRNWVSFELVPKCGDSLQSFCTKKGMIYLCVCFGEIYVNIKTNEIKTFQVAFGIKFTTANYGLSQDKFYIYDRKMIQLQLNLEIECISLKNITCAVFTPHACVLDYDQAKLAFTNASNSDIGYCFDDGDTFSHDLSCNKVFFLDYFVARGFKNLY